MRRGRVLSGAVHPYCVACCRLRQARVFVSPVSSTTKTAARCNGNAYRQFLTHIGGSGRDTPTASCRWSGARCWS